jgi:hypothetical protein
MSTIVTRSGKGSALTQAELDDNFTNLNTDKLENVAEDTTPQLGGNLDAQTYRITNLTDPLSGQDAATKSYVDSATSSSYGDSDVDSHLNTGTATASQVLSWTGSDYDWVDSGGGGGASAINDLSDATTVGTNNIGLATNALSSLTTGNSNTCLGWDAGKLISTGSSNTCIGRITGDVITTQSNNVAVGQSAIGDACGGNDNTCVGNNAGRSVASENTFIGSGAGRNGGAGSERNAVVGKDAMYFSGGDDNCALGMDALYNVGNGSYNVALGAEAGKFYIDGQNYTGSFSIMLGYNARVSGGNQCQLGNSSVTTYAYGSVQDRSDQRDKTDIEDTQLGLSFIKDLRPVDFRWDYREDYFDKVETETIVDGETVTTTTLQAVPKDGSRKRNRKHHGLIAQEVKQVMDAHGVDFAGYQDHSIKGGNDVLSIGYSELIAPLIKAVQELSAQVEALQAEVDALKS